MALRHSASFLQTFHTAQTAAQRTAASETATPTDHMDTDPAALAFVKGQAAKVTVPGTGGRVQAYAPQPVGTVVEVSGWKVLTGLGLVTEKQAAWMISIAHRPSVTDAMRDSLRVRLEQGFARGAASEFITKYKDIPTAAAEAAKQEAIAPGSGTTPAKEFQAAQAVVKTRPEVADGRYAVEDEDGTLKFYKLKNGRKAGYVFLDVQASDDWFAIRNPRRIDAVLAAIVEAGELNAARRYGIELGKCSRCGRTLTDETSRAYGIGPDCRAK